MSIQQSRYSVLRDDDDGERGKRNTTATKDNRVGPINTKSTKSESGNKTASKSQKTKKKTKQKAEKSDGNQWEQWKITDEKALEKQFVDDLKTALLESKSLFEEKKKSSSQENENNAPNQPSVKRKIKNEKSTKSVTVGLDEFLESDNLCFKSDLLKREKQCVQSNSFKQYSFDDICNKTLDEETINPAVHSRFSVLDDDDDTGFIQKLPKKKNQKDLRAQASVGAKEISKDTHQLKQTTKKASKNPKTKKSKDNQNMKDSEEANSGFSKELEANSTVHQNVKVSNKNKSFYDEALDATENSSAQKSYCFPSDNLLPINFQEELLLREVRNEVEKIMRQEAELESSTSNGNITTNGFGVELRAKNDLIERYGKEIISLREELRSTKIKNKKLIDILKAGEMKDKTEILVENERLTQVNEELKEEVSRLFATLEQEKSKVHELQDKIKRLTFNSQRKRSEDSLSKQ